MQAANPIGGDWSPRRAVNGRDSGGEDDALGDLLPGLCGREVIGRIEGLVHLPWVIMPLERESQPEDPADGSRSGGPARRDDRR